MKQHTPFLYRPEFDLYLAILGQAVRDLSSINKNLRSEAYEFLCGPVARYYAALIDVDPVIISRAIAFSCDEKQMQQFSGHLPEQCVTRIASTRSHTETISTSAVISASLQHVNHAAGHAGASK